MEILKMTATFGKLDNETLVFHRGLNIICAPNEFGKSTWATFLLTMLYGIDTAQRATKTNLPIKSKYAPWSGKPMAGAMDILWNGQKITIERATNSRTPMGDFSCFYTETGEKVRDLTENNCGEVLLGVGRSVFQRSGFIGQQNLSIGADASLESRLMALVTSGDEGISYSQTRKKLVDLRNRRRHNKTGTLPQTEEQLADVARSMATLSALHNQRNLLHTQVLNLQEEFQILQKNHEVHIAQQIAAAKDAYGKKVSFFSTQREKVLYLPAKNNILLFNQELAKLGEVQASQGLVAPVMPAVPDCPMGFEGLSLDQVRHRYKSTISQLSHLKSTVKPPKSIQIWPISLFFPLSIGAYFWSPYYALIPLVGAGIHLYFYAKSKKAYRNWAISQEKRAFDIQQIMDRFGVRSQLELEQNYQAYLEKLLVYHHEFEKKQVEMQDFREKNQDFLNRRQAFFDKYEVAFPAPLRLSSAQETFAHAIQLHQTLEVAEGEMETGKRHLDTVLSLASHQIPPEITDFNAKTQRAREKLALLEGQISAFDDLDILEQTAEKLRQEKDKMEQEYAALTLAIDALDRANVKLQCRFSPALNKLASDFFGKLTNGKYDTIFVGQSMDMQTRQSDDIATRGALQLSSGTLDQLYLSVRLAIHQLILGANAPMVLDDALAFFDDKRAETAIKLLSEISKTTQIILFTCHNRENNWI